MAEIRLQQRLNYNKDQITMEIGLGLCRGLYRVLCRGLCSGLFRLDYGGDQITVEMPLWWRLDTGGD